MRGGGGKERERETDRQTDRQTDDSRSLISAVAHIMLDSFHFGKILDSIFKFRKNSNHARNVVLQVAMCCRYRVMQCVEVCCSVLQCVAVRWRVR